MESWGCAEPRSSCGLTVTTRPLAALLLLLSFSVGFVRSIPVTPLPPSKNKQNPNNQEEKKREEKQNFSWLYCSVATIIISGKINGTGVQGRKDECCQFITVQQAIDAVPFENTVRTIVKVCPGVYNEPVYVAKNKNFITLRGFCPEETTIRWNNTATKINRHQGSQVIGTGTFACGTFIVEGEDFIAENITFENSAPHGSHQAVSLRVKADRCAFYNCRFLGWQDTLYLHHGKQYIRDCYIEGSVDFIFGNSTALLEQCHIHCKSPGSITAQSRTSSQESTGYVFVRCVITGNGESSYTYLGRPWRSFARVVFLYTWMDACVKPEGWDNWNNQENEKSACFYQYRCSGPGSSVSNRVPWCRELFDDEAPLFLARNFIDPDPRNSWLSNTNTFKVPFTS